MTAQPIFPTGFTLDAQTGEAIGFESLAPGTYVMSGPGMRIHIDVDESGRARLRLAEYCAHGRKRLVRQIPILVRIVHVELGTGGHEAMARVWRHLLDLE